MRRKKLFKSTDSHTRFDHCFSILLRACLGSYDPALVPEAHIGLIKKDSTKTSVSTAVEGGGGQATATRRKAMLANAEQTHFA